MNDDVKAAVEWLRGVASIDPDDGPVAKLVRHLDGEPARQAAAVAAAREEWSAKLTARAAELSALIDVAKSESADRIAELEAERDDYRRTLEKSDALRLVVEAERDALRAQAKVAEQWRVAVESRCEKAEAQVEAARAFIEDDTCRHHDEKAEFLAAMDGAKP